MKSATYPYRQISDAIMMIYSGGGSATKEGCGNLRGSRGSWTDSKHLKFIYQQFGCGSYKYRALRLERSTYSYHANLLERVDSAITVVFNLTIATFVVVIVCNCVEANECLMNQLQTSKAKLQNIFSRVWCVVLEWRQVMFGDVV